MEGKTGGRDLGEVGEGNVRRTAERGSRTAWTLAHMRWTAATRNEAAPKE